MKKNLFVVVSLVVFLAGHAHAQTAYTLSQSIDYAIQNNVAVKNSVIDTQISDAQQKELIARGLPQIDASTQLIHNFNVQKIILENGVIPAFTNPNLPNGEVLAFQLQLNNVWTTQITASQVIFDKSLFTGIANASIYKSLASKKVERTKTDVAELVTKAYYGVLVSKKQLEFLDNNIRRVDSLYKETVARFKNGLVRQIAVDRIEVRLNNLKDERDKTEKLVELNTALLRFQMNVPKEETIVLADTLNETEVINSLTQTTDLNYSQRIEYDILKDQIKLSEAQTKALREGYYPKLTAFATSGYNPAATNLGKSFRALRITITLTVD